MEVKMDKPNLKEKYCHSCKKKSDTCEYLEKLNEATKFFSEDKYYNMYFNGYCYKFYISESTDESITNNFSGSYIESDIFIYIHLSCGVLKKYSIEFIRNFISNIRSSYSYTDNEESDKEDDENEVDFSSLSNEEKIEMLKEQLGIEGQIEIVQDSRVNAYTKNNNVIYITTGALNNLDFDELAFIIAHEDSHVESGHVQRKTELAEKVINEVTNVWTNKSGSFFQNLADTLKIGAAGLVAGTALSYSQEVEADVKAKQKLQQAGCSDEGGEKLFSRTKNGYSLTHPSNKLRRDILNNI